MNTDPVSNRTAAGHSSVISYEHPLSERVRTQLRLEDLEDRKQRDMVLVRVVLVQEIVDALEQVLEPQQRAHALAQWMLVADHIRAPNMMKRAMRCHDFGSGREASRRQYLEYWQGERQSPGPKLVPAPGLSLDIQMPAPGLRPKSALTLSAGLAIFTI
jgi:hypothetical protein